MAKIVSGIVGGWVYFAIGMALLVLLGAIFYHMPLNTDVITLCLYILLAQCLITVEYVAVFTAFGFWWGSGWAFLASCLFFTLFPGVFLLHGLFQGGSSSMYMFSILPSLIGISPGMQELGLFTQRPLIGISPGLEAAKFTADQPISLEHMAISPQFWSVSFVTGTLVVLVVITVLFTIFGMRMFQRKQL